MSKYTTELRFICEMLAGYDESQGNNNIETVISKARTKLFDFDYPVYNATQKARWERHFILYYYTNEICEETLGLWKLRLKARLVHIMNKYIRLYEVADSTYHLNPLIDTDYTRTYNGSDSSTENGTTTYSSDKWNSYSDTPQSTLQNISSNAYLTSASHDTNNDNSTGNTTKNGTNEHTETVIGKMGGKTYSEMLIEFQQAVYNIDAQLTDEFQDLFMNLW